MKRTILYFVIALFSLPCAAQNSANAKNILDKTATQLRKNSNLRTTFIAEAYSGNSLKGKSEGTLYLKGNKFHIKTNGSFMWFDGKTQWTYIKENEEVNINTPNKTELQQINPYNFINIYNRGFNYKRLSDVNMRGQKCYVINLLAQNKKQSAQEIELTIEQSTYRLSRIKMRQGSKNWTVIYVTSYASGQKFNDAFFRFNSKDFPHAEVVDLR